ncbi:hypothetical protein LEMLEM_LOCUS15336 [Lemmus lemmus]
MYKRSAVLSLSVEMSMANSMTLWSSSELVGNHQIQTIYSWVTT